MADMLGLQQHIGGTHINVRTQGFLVFHVTKVSRLLSSLVGGVAIRAINIASKIL